MNAEFEGLDLPPGGQYLRWYAHKHVGPRVFLEPGRILLAAAEAGLDVNTLRIRIEAMNAAMRRLKAYDARPEADSMTVIRLARAASRLCGEVEESMERFNLCPPRARLS